jgi:hypothetical protein
LSACKALWFFRSKKLRNIRRLLNLVAINGLILSAIFSGTALAERRPVLDQIRVPHNYYFREMYLPQLTSGPSALAWTPDGKALVYSMQGSLWMQAIDSATAVQLTSGPGYDFQPDVSPDGTAVVFVRYLADAVEIHRLDIQSGETSALTAGGAVNLEPRWSPDGSRLAFVSTRDTGRFHVFVGEISDATLTAQPIVAERQSSIARYYYSAFDHELSPVWAPDGQSLFYVSNAEVPYGTGNIMRLALEDGAEPVLVRREETSWSASPDVAPDGRRIAYASYLGRQWHQLWVTHVDGAAEPFPLTYGDFDVTAPRWSPDGSKIAYITNEGGDTAIRIQDFVGGRNVALQASNREYLVPMFDLDLRIVDIYGKPLAARVSVVGGDGRSYAPQDAWIHADDHYDRGERQFETKYFHADGNATLKVPAGATHVTLWRGLENSIERRLLNVAPGRSNALTLRVAPLQMPDEWLDWASGDVHVHMNYGGNYRNTPLRMIEQARAEDLDLVFNLIVNKEQRVPDIAYFSSEPDAASDDDVLLLHSQEYHTSYWGHMGLLGLNSHLLIPDYSAYPGTAAASLYPDNVTVARLAHEQGAAVGYVHPFDAPLPDPANNPALTNALPVNAALGLIDYYETVGFADHRTSAEVWYKLLNCGARIAAAGGTDAMANYASLRGPVGLDRTYVRAPRASDEPAARRDAWLAGLKAGASIASNGPLLGLTVNGEHPGGEIALSRKDRELQFQGFLRSAVKVDHLELVHNGKVVRSFDLSDAQDSADISGSITVEESGWLLLRAWNDNPHPMVLDIYPYATTSPVYVTVDGKAPQSPDDADYFQKWIENIRADVSARQDFNSEQERSEILRHLEQADAHYASCR